MNNYRLLKKTERWQLVSPEGMPFFLLAVNHCNEANQDDPKSIADNLCGWGFNAVGYGAPETIYDHIPFLAEIDFASCSHYLTAERFSYDDVFDTAFHRSVKESIHRLCERVKNNPNLIGYLWTDTPRWNLDIARRERANDWVSAMRRLGPTAPGKRTYVNFLKERYKNNTNEFHTAYRISISTFDELRSIDFSGLELTRPYVRADDEAFLGVIAEEMYGLVRETFTALDPHRLHFGERYKLHDYNEAVLKAASKHVDVISIQAGPEVGPLPGPGRDETTFDQVHFDWVHQVTDKPIYLCDHNVSFKTNEYPVTLWNQFENDVEAGNCLAGYMQESAKKPYIVGYGKCQYIDRYDPVRKLLKQGLINQVGKPYQVFIDQFKPSLEAVARNVTPAS